MTKRSRGLGAEHRCNALIYATCQDQGNRADASDIFIVSIQYIVISMFWIRSGGKVALLLTKARENVAYFLLAW
jgi:hypothetical protein